MKPHKHADLIKDWADGHQIELQLPNGEWMAIDDIAWYEDSVYRVKPPEPHPHQDLIDAHKAGKRIKVRTPEGWVDTGFPFFNNERAYRVKPETVTKYKYLYNILGTWAVTDTYYTTEEAERNIHKHMKAQIITASAQEFEI
jgi:hypothetical protein